MITTWDVYWITRLDGINGALIAISVIVGCIILFGSIPVCVEEMWESDNWPFIRRLYKVGVWLVVVSVLGLAFIPTTNQAAAIYLVPKIANNEQVQKLPDNAMRFLNGKFEEWINGMVEKKDKK